MRLRTLFSFVIATTTATLLGQAPPETRLEVIRLPDPAEVGRPATVEQLKDLNHIPQGIWSDAMTGDFFLSNSYANMVIGHVPNDEKDFNQSRQGSILDFYPTTFSKENFQLFQPTLEARPVRRILTTAIDYAQDDEKGTASVTVLGADSVLQNVAVDTTFEMQKGWPGVLATTVITNDSAEEVVIPALADMMVWGGMGTFLPSVGWTLTEGNIGKAEFVFARQYDTFIFVAPVEGFVELRHVPLGTTIVYKRDVKLAAGATTSYKRWMLTGLDDPSKLFSFVLRERGSDKYGHIAGTVQEHVVLPDGRFQPTADVRNSEVRITTMIRPDLGAGYTQKPYIYTKTDENGRFQVAVPPGEYLIASADGSRIYQQPTTTIRVKPNQISPVEHIVSKPSGLAYEIVDADTKEPLPGKVSVMALRGAARDPEFGNPGDIRSANMEYTSSGKGTLDLAPGMYRIVASHGTEYHMDEQRVSVEKLKQEALRFELKRAYKPTGWISADLSVLTKASPSSRTSPETRVISAVAEGLDWIVSADENVGTDLQEVANRLGLGARIRATQGIRLRGTFERPSGDFTVFPIETSGVEPLANSFKEAMNARQAIDRIRALAPNALLMANRPLMPVGGFLAYQGYNIASEFMPEGDLVTDVDALQVWEGKNQGFINQGLQAWTGFLFRGERPAAVAHSLSAGTFNEEPGYPRVYIPSKESDPKKLDVNELVTNIREGRVMMTNGPFIDMMVDGLPQGSTITTNKGSVELDLKVYAPDWANISGITININGVFVRKFILPAGSVESRSGLVYPNSGKPEDSKFRVTISEDSVLQVIVEGDEQLVQDPVNPFVHHAYRSNIPQGQRTLAFSAPVFIDANGDGLVDLKAPEVKDGGEVIPPF